jgi:uncharacterized protein (TIGR00251 family)
MADLSFQERSSFLQTRSDGVLLHVIIQPRASRNEITGVQQQALKIRLTAPPVEGAANKECLKFLADALGTSPSQLQIISGRKARRKTILIRGLPPQTILDTLGRLADL